jgi:hypothetical protein
MYRFMDFWPVLHFFEEAITKNGSNLILSTLRGLLAVDQGFIRERRLAPLMR